MSENEKNLSKLGAENTLPVKQQIIIDTERKGFFLENLGAESIGKIVHYRYDPLHKDSLYQYDKNPLVLILTNHSDGFAGINLHFLPSEMNAIGFISEVAKNLTNDKNDITTKMMVTYQVIQALESFSITKKAYRRYLTSRLRSRILIIDPSRWYESPYIIRPDFVTKSAAKKKAKKYGRSIK